MDPVPVEKTVVPQPAIPRVIGTLHLMFGSFLFILGLAFLGLVGSSFAENRPFKLDPGDTQNIYEQVHRELLAALEDREATTENREEKARLREQRLALAKDHRDDVESTLDVAAVNRDLLWMSWYFWADFVTGPVLNLLLLASGMGLTQLKEWARRMSVWVCALKIVRLAVLTVLLMVVVIPRTGVAMDRIAATKLGELMIAKLNFDREVQSGYSASSLPLSTKTFSPQVSIVEYFLAIVMLIFGTIYPAIALVFLTRPGARAACLLSEEEPD